MNRKRPRRQRHKPAATCRQPAYSLLAIAISSLWWLALSFRRRPSLVQGFLSRSTSIAIASRHVRKDSSCLATTFRRRNIMVHSKMEEDQEGHPDVTLFQKWMTHSDISFHELDDSTAIRIQEKLLLWYRKERRKLPWRGDPPPYDGSTAGINHNNKNKQSAAKNKATAQSNKITNFFQKTPASKHEKKVIVIKEEDTNEDEGVPPPHVPIPVSAYGIWVSEIMLQQTRVEAVIPYWIQWMKTFPTVHDLAAASEEQVNSHWAGLGFYRRARLLHQGAQMVVDQYKGELPQTVEGLLKITGIGPYTASAIASISFGINVPVVDGNVCRVLSRLTGIANHIKAPALKDKLGWDLAASLVQHSDAPGEVNQALMELGATYCAPSGTGTDPRDPLKDFYLSTRLANGYRIMKKHGILDLTLVPETCECPICDANGVQDVLELLDEAVTKNMTVDEARKTGHSIFPLNPPKGKRREEDLAVGVISSTYNGETRWLLVRRPGKGLLADQWEFPSVCVEKRIEGQSKPPTPGVTKRRKALTEHLHDLIGDQEQTWWSTKLKRESASNNPLEHIFSHIKHVMWLEIVKIEAELSVLGWKSSDGREVRWMDESDMKEVGITSGVKKILKTVQLKAEKKLTVGKRKR